MFSFFDMIGTYEDRAVAHFEDGHGLIVDTAKVNDAPYQIETAIQHPAYHDGQWIIVGGCDDVGSAQALHDKWVGIMTQPELPAEIVDRSGCGVAKLLDIFGGDSWRVFKRQDKEADRG